MNVPKNRIWRMLAALLLFILLIPRCASALVILDLLGCAVGVIAFRAVAHRFSISTHRCWLFVESWRSCRVGAEKFKSDG